MRRALDSTSCNIFTPDVSVYVLAATDIKSSSVNSYTASRERSAVNGPKFHESSGWVDDIEIRHAKAMQDSKRRKR